MSQIGATLHHDRCRYQIKDVINESRVKFVQDTVKAIDVQNKKVTLSQGDIPYDYLVIGLGAVPETFGIKGLKEFAFPIANINTSRQLKDHIELQFATYNTAVLYVANWSSIWSFSWRDVLIFAIGKANSFKPLIPNVSGTAPSPMTR